jgi:capsular polysaccharide biosynthesis protein
MTAEKAKSALNGSSGPDTITLAGAARFFRRNLAVILVPAVLLSAIVFTVVRVFLPDLYEASATLVIVPPPFASELTPSSLTVQGYQKLLESDVVIADTNTRLREAGHASGRSPLQLGRDLSTRIFVSRRAEETSLAPMVQVVSHVSDPHLAEDAANTWADVFLQRVDAIVTGTTSSSVELIEVQYPQARAKLHDLESESITTQNRYQSRYNRLESDWSDRMTAHKNNTTRELGAHEAATTRILEELRTESNIDTLKQRVTALQTAYSSLQDEQARVESTLRLRQLQLESAHERLRDTPQYTVTRKAITDEALWGLVADAPDEDVDWNALQKRQLTTQDINSVYEALLTQVNELEIQVNSLAPRASQLEAELVRIADQLKTISIELGAATTGYDTTERERKAEYEVIEETRANELADLERARQEALDGLSQEWDVRTGQIGREISQQKDFFLKLAQSFNQAQLAKAQSGQEAVRLGAPAVRPSVPLPKGTVTKSFIGLILGGILGLVLAAIREALAPYDREVDES